MGYRWWMSVLAGLGMVALGLASGRGERAVTTVSAETLSAGLAVSGDGKAVGQPDMASMNLGVSARAATAKDAMAQAGAAMAKVIEAIRAVGIPDRDLRTSDISLFPQQDRTGQVTGYEGRKRSR